MKKLVLLILAMMLGAAVGLAQKINGMGVFMSNNQSFISTTTDLDSITYKVDPETKAIIQQIWEKDSLYKYPISTIDSTQFETFELPEGIIIKDGIGDWSEMRITKDGLCMLQKFYEDSDIPEKLVMFGKSENGDSLLASILCKEDGTPSCICFNDYSIIVDSIYNDSIDFTVAYKDSVAIIYKFIPFGKGTLARGTGPKRSFKQLNLQAKITAIVQTGLGAIELIALPESTIALSVGGAIVVCGNYILTSDPDATIWLYNIISNGIIDTWKGAYDLFNIGLSKIFVIDYWPEYNSNGIVDLAKSIAIEVLSQKCLKFGGKDVYNFLVKIDPKDVTKESNMTAWIPIILEGLIRLSDTYGGRIYTISDMRKGYEGGISTEDAQNISRTKYLVRSFVSPKLLRHPADNHIIDCTYGIIVYKDGKAFTMRDWYGDMAEQLEGHLEVILNNLEPETTYEYQVYFYDRENGIKVEGKKKSFRTSSLSIPKIENFEVLDATYSEEEFPYGEETYPYKFDCAMTVQMDTTEGMEDYGYIYKGVDDNESFVSLKGHQFPYTDANYVYYRKRSYSTASFCGYVKYYNDDNIYRGEWKAFDLAYGKYPTPGKMIDLGLSVKWAAYNIGADFPEETGNLYAWGEIETKEEYTWQTYKYRYGGAVIYCNNLGNISGNSQYDAARSIWGYGWRIPQSHEVQELVLKCKKEDFVYEGVNGMLFTGPNGNSIFVPKMSYWLPLGVSANYTGQTACTWYPHTNDFMATNGGSDKYVGRPIRAVYGY